MRLINTHSLIVKDFMGPVTESYAILSHRWDSAEQELTYSDYCEGRKRDTSGYRKIRDFCQIARQDGWDWAWADTCCIDKTSSSELSEAINSMFRWYARSASCYVYLNDVGSGEEWRFSQWFIRGWTLQELIAPTKLNFFNQSWTLIGTRSRLCQGDVNLPELTGIPEEVLRVPKAFLKYSVAQRMSWVKARSTTRVEDRAYCLLGIFQINMPLLYGEGKRAYRRLQLEILQQSPDETILAWFSPSFGPRSSLEDSPRSILADTPSDFFRIEYMYRWPLPKTLVTHRNRLSPPRVTSWGIELRAPATKVRALPPFLEHFDRTHGSIRESDGGPVLWVLALTTLLPTGTVEIPYFLMLAQCSSNPDIYHRWECFSYLNCGVPNAREFLAEFYADHYKIIGEEEDKTFYLYCGDRYDDYDDDRGIGDFPSESM